MVCAILGEFGVLWIQNKSRPFKTVKRLNFTVLHSY